MKTVVLLLASNVFMTIAWYGHLRFKTAPLLAVILVSWLIALPEYALQVPANRLGHGRLSAAQLKIVQEVISISVFVVFSWWYLSETPRWNEWLAMGLMVLAVGCAFGRGAARPESTVQDTAAQRDSIRVGARTTDVNEGE